LSTSILGNPHFKEVKQQVKWRNKSVTSTKVSLGNSPHSSVLPLRASTEMQMDGIDGECGDAVESKGVYWSLIKNCL